MSDKIAYLPLPADTTCQAVLDRAGAIVDAIESIVLVIRLTDGQLKAVRGGCGYYEALGLLEAGKQELIRIREASENV